MDIQPNHSSFEASDARNSRVTNLYYQNFICALILTFRNSCQYSSGESIILNVFFLSIYLICPIIFCVIAPVLKRMSWCKRLPLQMSTALSMCVKRLFLYFEPIKPNKAILLLQQGPSFAVALFATMIFFSTIILISFNSPRDLFAKKNVQSRFLLNKQNLYMNLDAKDIENFKW